MKELEVTMPRFFVEECLDPAAADLVLEGDNAYHIGTVLRMRPGDTITVCDGARTDLTAVIDKIEPGRIHLLITGRKENSTEPVWQAVLFQGLPKGDKMDQIIQKAVELGVSAIVPVICQRSVVKVSDSNLERKLLRWNRIALEAAKQCGRGRIPEILQPVSFAQAVEMAMESDLSFMPWEDERQRSLKNLLQEYYPDLSDLTGRISIGFVIGPEGGFSNQETALARQSGLACVTLGPRILRTETASLAVLAMLGYQFEQN
jgi:16S rRNA (uracil1498-N3)-methyltransferase